MPRSLPKKAKISHQPGPAVLARPELAIYIARIATGWSHIEQFFGRLVVQCLGAHAHTGMKMYQALSGSASRNAVLRAVARDRLSAELLDELEQVMRLAKSAGRKRNNVVHGIWQVSDDHPNALVWHDSADDLLSQGEFWEGWLSRSLEDRFQWALHQYKTVGPKHYLYEVADFEDILDEMNTLNWRLQSFAQKISLLNEPSSDEPSLTKG